MCRERAGVMDRATVGKSVIYLADMSGGGLMTLYKGHGICSLCVSRRVGQWRAMRTVDVEGREVHIYSVIVHA